jgi:hypothetical protein
MSGPAVPTVIATPFASSAPSGAINVVPDSPPLDPSLACYELGFPQQDMQPISGGGTAPHGQDFNGIFYDITSNIAWLQAGQGFAYNSTIATAIGGYNKGAVLTNAAGNGSWISLANGNTNNPDTTNPSTNNWQALNGVGVSNVVLTGSNVTLTAAQASAAQIYFTGTLTGNVIVTFPSWLANWWVNNDTAVGPYTITLASSGGGDTLILPLGGTYIYGDSSNILYASTVIGEFTGVYAGISGGLSETFYYTRQGNQVMLTLGAMPSSAASGTSFSVVGIPANLIPQGQPQYCPIAIAQDNSAPVGTAFAIPQLVGSTPTLTFGLNGIAAGWTASGNRRVLGTIVYDLLAGG